MAKRLRDVCALPESEPLWRAGRGFVVSFDYTDDAMRKADAFFRRSGESIVLFTVQETLEEHLAKKLA